MRSTNKPHMQKFTHIRLIDPTTGAPKQLELPPQTGSFPNARGEFRTVASHAEIEALGEEAASELLIGLKKS